MLFAFSRCWTPAMPASNVGRQSCQRPTLAVWLNQILKRRFGFVRRFLSFIASCTYCYPHACYLTPVLVWHLALHAFSWFLPWICLRFLFCILLVCIVSTLLHCFLHSRIIFLAFASFPMLALFSVPLHRSLPLCIVFRALASFSVLSHHFPHPHCFLHPFCFVPCMSLALLGFPHSFVLSPAFALGQ